LGIVNRGKTINRFDFNNYPVIHNKVQPVTTIKLVALVKDGQWLLLFDLVTASCKLKNKAGFVGRFQETKTKGTMDINWPP
jgi:hypothetical protein